jgi:hypothetical protein
MIRAIRGCMKQTDAYKLLAAFMILIMIIVPLAYMVTSQRSDLTSQTPGQQPPQEKYNPEYWVLNQPFYSISDALNMTPPGVVTADYVDLESMTPQMAQWARTNLAIINEADSIYNSSSTKVYYSNMQSGENTTFLLLSTMSPEKNDFEYIMLPNTQFPVLIRQEPQLRGLYNIMGTPVILAQPQVAIGVLNIIFSQNKTTTAYDQYEGLLSNVEPAQFQVVNSSVSYANQFYMGIGTTANETYVRTTAYLNINPNNFTRLNQLRINSTQRGFEQYNVTRSGNYTIVRIVSHDLFSVLKEETS